jgi:hypothetical protein
MKRFIQGEHRGQSTLLPESLDDYVSDTNPVRVVDVFVEEMGCNLDKVTEAGGAVGSGVSRSVESQKNGSRRGQVANAGCRVWGLIGSLEISSCLIASHRPAKFTACGVG